MNLNIRFPRKIWRDYLKELEMGEISDFCREAIIEKAQKQFSNKFLDEEIEFHNNKVKELKERKKSSGITENTNRDEIKKILSFYAKNYQDQAVRRTDQQRYRFCEKTLIPNLKKFGSTKTAKEIDDILINWPREEDNE